MPDARKENEARAKLSQLQRSLAREEMKTKQGGGARGSGVAAVREMRPKEVTFVASWGNASHLRRKAKGSLMRDNAIATPLPSSSSLVVDIACGETGAVAIDVDGNAIVHSDGKATRIKNVRVSRAAIGAKSVYLVSEKKLYELDANALGKRRVVNLWQKEVALVCCGANHCLVATRCGALFAWGEAKAGQLGLGDGVKKRVNKPSLVSRKRVLLSS